MAGGAIASLFVSLGLDAKGFTQGLTDAQRQMKGFGLTVSPAFAAVGVAAATAFGFATKGAIEAQEAQGNYMAATGASREEAKNFVSQMDALAGSAGSVGRSFGDIAATGTMVASQFGVSGDKARALTENILEFAKVTRTDAVGAAADIEDTLSAFGLTADDAAGFMDKLVASSQKYGTQVGPEQLAVLRNMSPALQAMGQNVDDAIGLLNIFEVAGLDAATAQRGLNTAITKLPSGTTLDDFIRHLSDLKRQGLDPTTEAIKIFGTRAGPALAKAIQPGMTSLSDLTVSAQDAQGAVTTAADAMQTDAQKIGGVFQKLMAGAREVGQDFGPVLLGLSSIGSLAAPLAKSFGGLIGGLIEPLTKVAADVGAKIGARLGTSMAVEALGPTVVGQFVGSFRDLVAAGSALVQEVGIAGGVAGRVFGLAFAAAAVFAVPMLAKELGDKSFDALQKILGGPTRTDFENIIKGRMQQTGESGGTTLGTAVATSYEDYLANWAKSGKFGPPVSRSMWEQTGETAGQQTAAGFTGSYEDYLASWARSGQIGPPVPREIWERAGAAGADGYASGFTSQIGQWGRQGLPAALREGIAGGAGKVRDAFGGLFGGAVGAAKDAADRVSHAAGVEFSTNLADTIRNAKDTAKSAMEDLIYAMQHPRKRAKDIAYIEGQLASKALRDGLNSNDPAIRHQAEVTRDLLVSQWEALKGEAYSAASSAVDTLEKTLATFKSPKFVVNWPKVPPAFRPGHLHDLPEFAAGGELAAGRLGIVGEKGPELVRFSQQAQISPLSDTIRALAPMRASGGDIHLHVGTLIADDVGLRELERRIANALRHGMRARATT